MVVEGANANHPGAAYVFTEPASGWANMSQTAELTASDGAEYEAYDDNLGFSVSINGKTVAIGMSGNMYNGNTGQGAAYVYTEPGLGWVNMTESRQAYRFQHRDNQRVRWLDFGGWRYRVGRSVGKQHQPRRGLRVRNPGRRASGDGGIFD